MIFIQMLKIVLINPASSLAVIEPTDVEIDKSVLT